VWRIVEDNRGSGEALAKAFRQSPIKPYAFVIEILCVAFHSIAHRSRNSIWDEIINGPLCVAAPPLYASRNKSHTRSNVHENQNDTSAASESDLGIGDEDEYESFSEFFDDSAYEGSAESEDEVSEKQRLTTEEEPSIELGAAILVRLCDSGFKPVHMIDEAGEAITGYYTRSKGFKDGESKVL
jgi:hypothetical protein